MIRMYLVAIVTFIFISCERNMTLELETQIVELEHDIFLENQLSGLGLVDMTKLSETLKKEIEEMQIVRFADFPSKNYAAQIVMIDANRNGKFEYDSIDMFGLSGFKESFQIHKVNFTKSKEPVVVKIGKEFFEVNLREDGTGVELVAKGEEKDQYVIAYPYLLPEVEFKKLTKNAALQKNNGKFTYVEFWGTWCKPCIEIVPDIKKLKNQFDDHLNIVSVNYRDQDMDRVKRFILKKKMNWDHIVATRDLLEEFGNPNFVPCGILFDPQGRLIQYGIEPDEVKAFLTK